MNLFIDTTGSYLIMIIFNKKIIDEKIIITNNNQAEIFIDELNSFLKSNNLDLINIENFFFAKGPGSFTGIRVGLTFAKALKASGFKHIYTINSLQLLLTNNSKAIIDARGKRYYYQELNDNIYSNPQIITEDIIDFNSVNTYEKNLLNIKDNLLKLIELNEYSDDLNPLYLKEAF